MVDYKEFAEKILCAIEDPDCRDRGYTAMSTQKRWRVVQAIAEIIKEELEKPKECPDCPDEDEEGVCWGDPDCKGKPTFTLKELESPNKLMEAIMNPCPMCGKFPTDENSWTGAIDDYGFGVYCYDPCAKSVLGDGDGEDYHERD